MATMCMSQLKQEIPVRNAQLTSDHQRKEFKERKESEVAQSCLTLSDPVDCSLRGSSTHGIFQARALELAAISWERSKRGDGSTCVLPASQDPGVHPGRTPASLHPSRLRKDPESGLARDSLDTRRIAVRPQTVSPEAGQPPGALLCLLSTRCPFPTESPALSEHVSPRTIHVPVSDQSALWGLPSCNSAVQASSPALRPLQVWQGTAVSLETNVTHAALKICFLQRGQCYNWAMDSSEELKKCRSQELIPYEQHLIY